MPSLLSRMLLPVRTSPLPPPLDDTCQHASYTCLRGVGKRLGLLSWRPAPGRGSRGKQGHVYYLVLGDSYADDIDMAFTCWPALLARARGGSCLNVARGGSRCADADAQLERAASWMARTQTRVSEDTVVVVHLGGNDMLHALQLLGPVALLLLWFDCLLLAAGRFGLRPRLQALPRCSFFGFLARRIAAGLTHLLAKLAARGHAHVLVANLPLCAAMPLPRRIIGLLTCAWAWRGGPQLVTHILDDAVALLDSQLRAALEAVCAKHGVCLSYLDEARLLVSAASRAHGGGEAAVSRVRIGDAVWKDAHHPRPWVHDELAAAAAALLERGGTPAPAAPTGARGSAGTRQRAAGRQARSPARGRESGR